MLEKAYKALLVAGYLVLMAAVLDFEVALIINLPMILYLMIGTALLTVIYLKRGQGRQALLLRVRLHLLITASLITFLSQLSLVAGIGRSEHIELIIIRNFLPIFYAMLFILLIDLFKGEHTFMHQPLRSQQEPVLTLKEIDLTKRERMIAEVLAENISNKEIGERLYIAENTVKKHINNIFRKTGVKNRTEFIHQYMVEMGGDEDVKK